jgi:hypothetical protein
VSARKSAYAIVDHPCDGGVSPNAYRPAITAEVRVFYPPNTVTKEQVMAAFQEAVETASAKIEEHLG